MYTQFQNQMVRYPDAQSDRCPRGEAKLCIFNFKTTWSEFQKPLQSATERGEAKLHILNLKTIWSEFQKPCQTAATRGQAAQQVPPSNITNVAQLYLASWIQRV